MVNSFLIIDDQKSVGEAFVSMIRRRGDSATYVRNARSALEKLASGHYDAALIDGGMDVPVDGVTLTQRMEDPYPSVRRIGMSCVYFM